MSAINLQKLKIKFCKTVSSTKPYMPSRFYVRTYSSDNAALRPSKVSVTRPSKIYMVSSCEYQPCTLPFDSSLPMVVTYIVPAMFEP